MNSIIRKTVFGLTKAYHIRQTVFGSAVAGLLILVANSFSTTPSPGFYVALGVLVALYPYARFAYESTVDFIIGDTIILLPLMFMALWKYLTITMCFALSPVLAPIGMVMLYFINHSAEKESLAQLSDSVQPQ